MSDYAQVLFEDLVFYDCIGYGSFGSVYKALWISEGKEVAVKKVLRLDKEVGVCCQHCLTF